ncbi:MAG TPA: VOC family protein [Ideonella sp.]|nr:VOC family protein [Ideonella sp.]
MQHTEVDHLVVVAHDLAQGAAWCQETLGVAPQAGGRHALMGTHNLLLAVGSPAYPKSYLEIIAIDPQAPAPGRKRWFGMDDAALQARVREVPELVGFVARSGMVDMHRWGLIHCGYVPGPILKASRETPAGLLQWQIVVPDDGAMLAGGALPLLIQWQGPHPSDALADSGVQLTGLGVRGLPDKAAQVLRLRPLERLAPPGPALSVRLQTPRGERALATTPPA